MKPKIRPTIKPMTVPMNTNRHGLSALIAVYSRTAVEKVV